MKSLSAFVRDLGRCFLQDQTSFGDNRVDSPGQGGLRQLAVVEVGVLSSKRKKEASLSIDISVAGPRVTAGFRENSHDVNLERHVLSRIICDDLRASRQHEHRAEKFHRESKDRSKTDLGFQRGHEGFFVSESGAVGNLGGTFSVIDPTNRLKEAAETHVSCDLIR